MSTLTLIFSDGLTLDVDANLLAKYPSSVFVTFLNSVGDRPTHYRIDHLTKSEFNPIYQMLIGDVEEEDLSSDQWIEADKFGLTNDVLYYFRRSHEVDLKLKLRNLKNFISGKTKLYIPDPIDYEKCSVALRNHSHIVPVQVLAVGKKDIVFVSIANGCPIRCRPIYPTLRNYCAFNEVDFLTMEGNIDVIRLRYQMIFKIGPPADIDDFNEYKKHHNLLKDKEPVVRKICETQNDGGIIENWGECDFNSINLGNLLSNNIEKFHKELSRAMRAPIDWDNPWIHYSVDKFLEKWKQTNEPIEINIMPGLPGRVLLVVDTHLQQIESTALRRELDSGLIDISISHNRDYAETWVESYTLIKCFVNVS